MSKELDSRDDFDRLSAALDPERDSAGAGFELLRDRLIRYFAYRRCDSPEDLAMETLERVMRKIAGGQAVDDISRYVYGVARNVLYEELRSAEARARYQEHEFSTKSEAVETDEAAETDEKERRIQCLEKCAQQLTQESRVLLFQYFQEKGATGKENRKMLAERLGISREALTLRVFHLKRELRKCIEKCLERASEQG